MEVKIGVLDQARDLLLNPDSTQARKIFETYTRVRSNAAYVLNYGEIKSLRPDIDRKTFVETRTRQFMDTMDAVSKALRPDNSISESQKDSLVRGFAMASVDTVEGFYFIALRKIARKDGKVRSSLTEEEFDKSVNSLPLKALRLDARLLAQDLNFSKEAEQVIRSKAMDHFTELTGIDIVRSSK